MEFQSKSGHVLDAAWNRVESADGVFDDHAIARCRAEIETMRDKGVRPLLALWHFDCPVWLGERGGFANRDNVTAYLLYVRKMVESVGDLVDEYITFYEPSRCAFNGYFAGTWPPGQKSFLAFSRVMTNLTAAHIEAYGLIRKTRLQMGFRDTKAGFVNRLYVFAPKDPADPVQRFGASRAEQLFQGGPTRAMCLGRAAFPIGRHPAIVPGRYCDFHGVSGCVRCTVGGDEGSGEPYPEGLAEAAEKVCGLLPRPVFLTGDAPRGEEAD